MNRDFEQELIRRKILRKDSTPQEILLWSRLRNNQLGCKFRRQHHLGPYIADFYCHEKKIVIEIDGSQHMDAKEYDERRDQYFETFGFKVLRFWNNEINSNLEGVLLKIISKLKD